MVQKEDVANPGALRTRGAAYEMEVPFFIFFMLPSPPFQFFLVYSLISGIWDISNLSDVPLGVGSHTLPLKDQEKRHGMS